MKPLGDRAIFQDIADLEEDKRIEIIGKAAFAGNSVAFVTDADPGKADRYINKLLTRFPSLEVKARQDGPVPGTVSVRVGLKIDKQAATKEGGVG